MLHIEFHYFRCWENLLIEAPLGKITLIRGGSGIGKSTILQGIAWCLYGNVRLVEPINNEKAKTKVILQLPYTIDGIEAILKIQREKNPNRLLVSHESKTYEDKIAQCIIDDIFGKYDIWLASCYIGQGSRNSFLTAPNKGKMELLNSIAFHEEDPTTFIEKIDANITQKDIDYKSRMTVFNKNLEILSSQMSNINCDDALNCDAIKSINIKLSELHERGNALQKLRDKRLMDLGIINNLQQELQSLQSKNIILPSANCSLIDIWKLFYPTDDTLINLNIKSETIKNDIRILTDNMAIIIKKLLQLVPLLRDKDRLWVDVTKYDNLISNNKDGLTHKNCNYKYTEDDYQKALYIESIFNENSLMARNLNISYDSQSINNCIKEYRDLLDCQEHLRIYNQLQSLKSERMMMFNDNRYSKEIILPEIIHRDIPIPDYSKYSTESLSNELNLLSSTYGSLETHIKHLHNGWDVLECPKCKVSLRYRDDKLLLADTHPSNKDELNNAHNELHTIGQRMNDLKKQIETNMKAEAMERENYEKARLMEEKRLEEISKQITDLRLKDQKRKLLEEQRLNRINQLDQSILNLQFSLQSLPHSDLNNKKLLSNVEIDNIHSLIAKLSNIKIVEPPTVSSDFIKSSILYNELLSKRDNALNIYKNHLDTISSTFIDSNTLKYDALLNMSHVQCESYIEVVRSYINQLTRSIDDMDRWNTHITSLHEKIENMLKKIAKDPSDDIADVEFKIKELKDKLNKSDKTHEVLNFHKLVTKEREEIVELNTLLSDLHTLRHYAVDTECKILQQIVDSINESIQDVCSTLFDRDININLNLFKTLKTNKHVKPVVNFNISYNGGLFDNINHMSYGEGDRASIALTLALNRLSGCPILMLDESLASLDLDSKESVIETIRINTNNTVFIVMHDGIEGIFDHVINVDDIRYGYTTL